MRSFTRKNQPAISESWAGDYHRKNFGDCSVNEKGRLASSSGRYVVLSTDLPSDLKSNFIFETWLPFFTGDRYVKYEKTKTKKPILEYRCVAEESWWPTKKGYTNTRFDNNPAVISSGKNPFLLVCKSHKNVVRSTVSWVNDDTVEVLLKEVLYISRGPKRLTFRYRVNIFIPYEKAWELVSSYEDANTNGSFKKKESTCAISINKHDDFFVDQIDADSRDAKRLLLLEELYEAISKNKLVYTHAKYPLIAAHGLFCSYCETPLHDGMNMDVEHKLPKAQFPSVCTDISNLVGSCKICNSLFKGSHPNQEFGIARIIAGAKKPDPKNITFRVTIDLKDIIEQYRIGLFDEVLNQYDKDNDKELPRCDPDEWYIEVKKTEFKEFKRRMRKLSNDYDAFKGRVAAYTPPPNEDIITFDLEDPEEKLFHGTCAIRGVVYDDNKKTLNFKGAMKGLTGAGEIIPNSAYDQLLDRDMVGNVAADETYQYAVHRLFYASNAIEGMESPVEIKVIGKIFFPIKPLVKNKAVSFKKGLNDYTVFKQLDDDEEESTKGQADEAPRFRSNGNRLLVARVFSGAENRIKGLANWDMSYQNLLKHADNAIMWPDKKVKADNAQSNSFSLTHYKLNAEDKTDLSIDTKFFSSTLQEFEAANQITGFRLTESGYDITAKYGNYQGLVNVLAKPTVKSDNYPEMHAIFRNTVGLTGLNSTHGNTPFNDQRMLRRTEAWFMALQQYKKIEVAIERNKSGSLLYDYYKQILATSDNDDSKIDKDSLPANLEPTLRQMWHAHNKQLLKLLKSQKQVSELSMVFENLLDLMRNTGFYSTWLRAIKEIDNETSGKLAALIVHRLDVDARDNPEHPIQFHNTDVVDVAGELYNEYAKNKSAFKNTKILLP